MPQITKPPSLCMAPWVHTYLSPQTERRMCCASREPAQNFKQYIDTDSAAGNYNPLPLDQHWNGEHMKSVRRRMMAGEKLPECEVCDNRLLNTDVYRDYFWHLFRHKYDDIWDTTDQSGATTMKPISWDYRFSNLCNFKCRHCGDMLSSAWESEQRQHNMIDWSDPKNNWMRPKVRKEISRFQDSVIEQEFSAAVERGDIEEIYWVGGEPLMYEQHWRYMQRIIELGHGDKLYARYNTNLSRIQYQGIHLFNNILPYVRDWQICASLDGTGEIGEYIRDGLHFDTWKQHYRQGLMARQHGRQMRIDFTLTLPGMLDVENIYELSRELDSEILAKVIFSFTPEVILSPLALPRKLLDEWVDEKVSRLPAGALVDVIQGLKSRSTFAEQWPDSYQSALIEGKARLQHIDRLRASKVTLDSILSKDPRLYDWYNSIG